MKHTYKIATYITTIVCMLVLIISCGDKKVTNCHQLDGTYWKIIKKKNVDDNDSLYHDKVGLVRFEDDSIYSGQTYKAMSYTCNDKEGRVGSIATFKLEENSILTIYVLSASFRFEQISAAEYDSIMEENILDRKKKKYNYVDSQRPK